MSPGCNNFNPRSCSISSQRHEHEPVVVMRRLPYSLLASLPLQTRRILFCNSARWSASLDQVSPPSGQGFKPPSTLPTTKASVGKPPFRFETGVALFAKRTPRPFPPPFLSSPSALSSDPLRTHPKASVKGELIKGYTNGDDAVFASEYFIAANDGVGAWSTRPRGHAGLWSRLIVHFWALEVQHGMQRQQPQGKGEFHPDPVKCLQTAYERTLEVTGEPNSWQGTTTATGAQLFYKEAAKPGQQVNLPLVYVTNLGDSQVMIVRPGGEEAVYKSKEQWHWFDCPRQLGTNSPDTPAGNAIMDIVEVEEGDVVLAMSDGVIDNLWEHEIVGNVNLSMKKWETGEAKVIGMENGENGVMQFVAEQLVDAAKVIALDPFAESPFMEHAIEEGLPSHGGKLDDISVVAAVCRKNN